jgi:hypothetical protein
MLLIICLLRSPANPEISCGMLAFISISNLICTRINSAFALISGMSNSAASGGNLLSIPSIVLGLRPAPSLKPPRPGPNFTNLSANNKTSFVIPHPGHYSPARNPAPRLVAHHFRSHLQPRQPARSDTTKSSQNFQDELAHQFLLRPTAELGTPQITRRSDREAFSHVYLYLQCRLPSAAALSVRPGRNGSLMFAATRTKSRLSVLIVEVF